LPLVSQSIFDLRPFYSGLVAVYLFGVNLALWGIPFGWTGVMNAFVGYAAGFAFTIVFTVITRQAVFSRRRADELRKQVETANERLREQAAQMDELATTRERNRLAREIHDGVGHYLTVVKTQLDAAAALLPSQPERAREAVTKAARLAGEALDDVRRSVGTLRTDSTRPPLSEAIQALAHDAGVTVTVRLEGAARAVPSGVEHALFRSAQEGLTNVCKHASASVAEITLDFSANDRVKLVVVDNGRGVNGVVPGGGFGLRGLRERVELLGGRVATSNRDEGGFELTVEVPA
jgi:signal transduction histidine kinase